MNIAIAIIFYGLFGINVFFQISLFITQYYDPKRMLIIEKQRWSSWNKNSVYELSLIVLALSIGFLFSNVQVASLIAIVAMGVNFLAGKHILFKWTRRSIMLLVTTLLIPLLLLIDVPIVSYVLATLMLVWPSALIILCNYLLYPIECMIKKFYINRAKKRLKLNPKLVIVAITGSYGKTSFKNYLYTLLYGKYNVIKTPGSINTPMGICKFINNNLTPYDDYLLLELGVDAPNTMKKFFKIFTPQVAVITAIGPMHLATFKTLENIKKEKLALFHYMKEKGAKFYNSDSFTCQVKDAIKYSFTDASVISQDETGTTFNYHGKECHVDLLGKHQITNLIGAIEVASYLKLPPDVIFDRLCLIKPEPQRMSISKMNKMTIIDDSYNANYLGMCEAISVITKFTGKKGIILNGLIELGKESEKQNYDLGTKLSDFQEIAILKSSSESLFKSLDTMHKKYKIFENYSQAFNYIKNKNLDYLLLCSNAHLEYIK